jgi:hypothetical protein
MTPQPHIQSPFMQAVLEILGRIARELPQDLPEPIWFYLAGGSCRSLLHRLLGLG